MIDSTSELSVYQSYTHLKLIERKFRAIQVKKSYLTRIMNSIKQGFTHNNQNTVEILIIYFVLHDLQRSAKTFRHIINRNYFFITICVSI